MYNEWLITADGPTSVFSTYNACFKICKHASTTSVRASEHTV